MSGVLHIGPRLEHISVGLLEQLATLNMALGLGVIEIATADHEDLGRRSRLHNLEVVGQNIGSALTVLTVDLVGGHVGQLEGLRGSSEQVEYVHFEAVIVQYEHLVTDRSAGVVRSGKV